MKLIFENWNKWLNEQEAPQTDQFINIRMALKEYFKPERPGGWGWISYLRANNPSLADALHSKAQDAYTDELQPRINEIIDGVGIKVGVEAPQVIGSTAMGGPEFGNINISPEDVKNKHVLYREFFRKIDKYIQNSPWCKLNACNRESLDTFEPAISGAFSTPERPLDKESVKDIYYDLHILRLRTSFDFPVERKQAKEFLNQIRRYGNKRNNIWYAPNIWEALRQMKKLHRSDEYIVDALNKIASNLPSEDTRDIA